MKGSLGALTEAMATEIKGRARRSKVRFSAGLVSVSVSAGARNVLYRRRGERPPKRCGQCPCSGRI